MAIIDKGILGSVRGRIDGLIGQIRWGLPTVANLREEYIWSSETEFQRAKMSKLASYGRVIGKENLQWMYPDADKKLTSWMRFIKTNYPKMDSSFGLLLDDQFIPKFQISKAQRSPQITVQIRRSINSTALFFSFRYGQNMNTTDVLYVLVSFPTLGVVQFIQTGRARSTNSATWTTVSYPVGTPFRALLIFRSADGKLVSQARLFTGTVIQS